MTQYKSMGWVFVLPAILIIGTSMMVPMGHTIFMSFTANSMMPGGAEGFVGFENYIRLFDDARFLAALGTTLTFTVVTVPLELALGLGLALILNRSFRGRGFTRVAILFPWALPTALNALIWRWLYHSDFGVFNGLLLETNLVSEPINWLGGIPMAMYAMMAVAIWKTSSFMALILLAGLQSIPEQVYESAAIDGANRLQAFRRITVPLLVPSMMVAVLLRSMDALRAFELPFNLTDGGPANTTETISLYAYRVLFQFIDFNFGATVVLVQFAIILFISTFYIYALRSNANGHA